MCEPECKRCAAQRVVGGPHRESIVAEGARARRTDRHLASRRECRTLGSPAATFCREAEPQARRVIASRAGATPLELTPSGGRSREDAQEADGQPARAYHRNAVRESCGATSLTRARQRRNFPDSFYIPSKLHSRPPTRQNRRRRPPFTAGISPTVHGPLGHLARASRRLCRAPMPLPNQICRR